MAAVGSTLMLVEDDRDIRESIAAALEEQGYTVVCAADGIDALEKLRAASPLPALILLDFMMPRMNGGQFRGEMLKVDAWKKIPVVVLTADRNAAAKAETVKAEAFMMKPLKVEDLFALVAKVLAGSAVT